MSNHNQAALYHADVNTWEVLSFEKKKRVKYRVRIWFSLHVHISSGTDWTKKVIENILGSIKILTTIVSRY